MRFRIRGFTEADGRSVAAWHYEPPYDVYDAGEDPEFLRDILDPGARSDVWFAVDGSETGELAGFLELTVHDDEVEIGLGMRPDLTGRGLGASFIGTALDFARERWGPARFALDVFPWNERAIRAYEEAGFERGDVYVRRFESGTEREFLRMERPA